MYHTMFPPPMLVQVGQQGHFEGHRQSRMPPAGNLPLNPYEHNGFVRRNEGSPRYSVERRPVKSYSLEDVSRPYNDAMRYGPKSHHILCGHSVFPPQNCGSVELLQLIGIEVPTVRLNYAGHHHPPSVRNCGGNNGGNGNSNMGNGMTPWRDRGGGGGPGPGMAPPPAPNGLRPITNCLNMKRVYWGNNKGSNGDPRRSVNHRSQNDRRRHCNRSPVSRGGDGASSEAYSSDSGFSSRSPTPSSQQVSPTATRCSATRSSATRGSGDEDTNIGAGEPTLHRVQGKMVKRAHEVNNYQQPAFFQHQHQHQHHRNPHELHQGVSLHHVTHHQKRSESLTSLGAPNNGYQSKRRFQSGRHSPPASLSSRNGPVSAPRGRRPNGFSVRHSPNLPQCFIAPERFLARSHLMCVTTRPSQLTTGDGWDELSEAMWSKFIKHQQTEETYRNKMDFWKNLYFYIKGYVPWSAFAEAYKVRRARCGVGIGSKSTPLHRYFPRYGLFLVGSTISGFGSNTSDMDMCLLVRHTEVEQRNEAVAFLEDVLKSLRECSFVRDPQLIQAKVPILKFSDTRNNLEVDLNCNNAVGIRNTHLLYCYSQMDWRVRPLVLVVKTWAAKNGINDAKNMTISSYSLVLMVINYLQCGVNPSVLPNLHALYPGKFSPVSDLHNIDLHEELRPYKSNNTQSLGQLLLGFLEYYANFDYNQDAISVRQARRVPIDECRHARSYKNDPHQWKYLCIEEPFDLTNTAHSVYDPEVFEKIKEVFHTSYIALKESRDLASIFRHHLHKDHPQEDHPHVDHPYVDHPYLNHPYVDHPYVDHPYVDHPQVDHSPHEVLSHEGD